MLAGCIRSLWRWRICLVAIVLPQWSHGNRIFFCWCQSILINESFFNPFKASVASTWLPNEIKAACGSPLYTALIETIFPNFEKCLFSLWIVFRCGGIPVACKVLRMANFDVFGDRLPLCAQSILMKSFTFSWNMKYSSIGKQKYISFVFEFSNKAIFLDGESIFWKSFHKNRMR